MHSVPSIYYKVIININSYIFPDKGMDLPTPAWPKKNDNYFPKFER